MARCCETWPVTVGIISNCLVVPNGQVILLRLCACIRIFTASYFNCSACLRGLTEPPCKLHAVIKPSEFDLTQFLYRTVAVHVHVI